MSTQQDKSFMGMPVSTTHSIIIIIIILPRLHDTENIALPSGMMHCSTRLAIVSIGLAMDSVSLDCRFLPKTES
jgi:hypothetical protein